MQFTSGNSMKWLFVMVMSLMLSNLALAQEINIPQDDPYKMVESLSNKVVAELNARREVLEKDPVQVKVFADAYILPYIDTEKMARYVMGKYWRTATEKQKTDFVNAFTNTMIRSYSQSLLKLRIESVNVEKTIEEKPGRVTVASSVLQSDGNKSDVIYRVYLNKKTKKWMLYDVVVEGVSMLLSYRKAYGSEISKKGLDTVITEMQSKNTAFNG
jgi:phospholipid transport system substrate-binding protein